MYFLNKNNHIVESIHHRQIDVDGSIAVYSDAETLQIDYPNITDDMIFDIPNIHIEENDSGTFYYLNSRHLTHELVNLEIGETIEDWMAEQAETFTPDDGMMF